MNGRALVGIIIVFGTLMFLDFILPFHIWEGLFPVLVIAVGIVILYPKLRFGRKNRWRAGGNENDENHVKATSIMGGGDERNRSKDFLGGQLTAFMGGVIVNLREAEVIEKPA